MKFLIVFALALASASALNLRSEEIFSRDRFLPVAGHEGRIAGGQNAEISEFGYQVGLSLKATPSGSGFWCGGSLIAPIWVLTAVHCTENMNEITVYLGGAKRQTGESQKLTRAKGCNPKNSNPKICNIIEHKDWNTNTMRNDIALIKIASVKESNNIWLVNLPAQNLKDKTFENENAVASGWGRMGDGGSSVASNLQYATMVVISNKKCASVYGTTSVTAGNICVNTDYSEGRRSTCQGDSGGPLVTAETNPRYRTQIGVTSFGAKAGCEKGFPVAFTRVTYYLDWINEQIIEV